MPLFGIILLPTKKQLIKYTKVINQLSKKYNTPEFDAHVTIIGKFQIEEEILIQKIKSIVKNTDQINLEMFGVNFTNTYFQCVFAQVRMSPALLKLREKLESNLKYPSKPAYFPHMSFIYGNFTPEEKFDIAKQIRIDKKLVLDKLIIIREGPTPKDWTRVAEFELKS